jgi:hypothetical protein
LLLLNPDSLGTFQLIDTAREELEYNRCLVYISNL